MENGKKGNRSGFRQPLHRLLVKLYCSTVFMFKNFGKVLPLILLSLKRLFRRNKYIFHLATPTHTNIGDQMIVFAMEKWCKKYLSEYTYIEYDDSIYKDWAYFDFLRLVVKKKDLIFLRGGGSVGDWYIGYEYFVRYVLKCYPNNKIVMFPQSIRFSSTPEGEREKEFTARAYDAHPDFTLYARDETSFALANEMFCRVKARLCPDIAMFLFNNYQPKRYERNGLFLCLRKDAENYYSDALLNNMTETLKKKYKVTLGDTGAAYSISAAQRRAAIEELLSLFSASMVSVTDRFHGVIAAVLTGTPCVVLRSADHKIVSGLQWFKDLDFVFYAETVEDVPGLIEKALQCEQPQASDFSEHFDRLFEEIANG